MYKIGDFSKITGASIRTLRYYDEIDLFKPDEVDLFTGYRYYSELKIKEYEIITELKDVGFTLDEIKEHWNKFNDAVMLDKKNQLLNESVLLSDKIKKIDKLRSYIIGGKIVINNEDNIASEKIKKIERNITSNVIVTQENIDSYIRYNGEKNSNSIIANTINNNQAIYYIIYLNNIFIDDFIVFNDDNELKIELYKSESIFTNKNIMNCVFKYLTHDFNYITLIIEETKNDILNTAYEYHFYNIDKKDNFIILRKDLRKDDYNE